MRKFFYVLNILVLLSLTGLLIYNEYYRVEPTQTVDPNVSEYTITVATNAGTVVDYVDYDVISADEYAIETVGFNRQFVQLSIYNTETEEQLQNGSAIEIDDELQINLALPEGYKLNAFFVDGYISDNSYLLTVSGNVSIYVDVEQIIIVPDPVSEYKLSIATNAGTVVDYVEYETISVENYAIETVGFNRQFVQLSIYNTETEEQLQNTSAIEIGDELQVNLAVPEGYRLNAFYVDGYYFANGDTITVTGDMVINVDIERIIVNMNIGFVSNNESYGTFSVSILSGDILTQYDYAEGNNYTSLNLYYGDTVTFTVIPSATAKIDYLNVYQYNNGGSNRLLGYEYKYNLSIELINPYSFDAIGFDGCALEARLMAS